jgi:hypothetical protein
METEVQEQRKPFGQSLAEAIKPFEEGLSVKPESKPEPKPDPKPEPKPEAKVQPKEVKPEPKVEAKDPDEDIISGKRNPKGEDFKRVKTAAAEAAKQRDEIKARAETFEKELTELKKAPKHNAELISKIEKERDDFRGKYEQVALAFDPDFNAGYQSKIDSVLANVKKMGTAERQDLAGPNAGRGSQKLVLLGRPRDLDRLNQRPSCQRTSSPSFPNRKAGSKERKGFSLWPKTDGKEGGSQKTGRAKLFDTVISKAMEENPVFKKQEGGQVQACKPLMPGRNPLAGCSWATLRMTPPGRMPPCGPRPLQAFWNSSRRSRPNGTS